MSSDKQCALKITEDELFLSDCIPIKEELFEKSPSYLCEDPLCCYGGVEIDIIVHGNGIHRVYGNDVPCRAGDIFITDVDTPHTFLSSESGVAFNVRRLWFSPDRWFEGDASDSDSERYCYGVFADCIPSVHAVLNESTKKRVDYLVDGIIFEKQEQGAEWREAVGAYLSMLLITLGRYVGSAIKNRREGSIRAKDRRTMSRAIREVMAGFGDSSLTLESIADSVYVSKSNLSRIFRDVVGESFGDYLREVRISSAKTLLCDTRLTVEEIARRCGFRDIPTFYKTMKTFY